MVIVDTTVWIDYLAGTLNPETEWLDRELDHQRLGLTDLILCEILQGLRSDAETKRITASSPTSRSSRPAAKPSPWPPH